MHTKVSESLVFGKGFEDYDSLGVCGGQWIEVYVLESEYLICILAPPMPETLVRS